MDPSLREQLLQCLGGPWPEPGPLEPLIEALSASGYACEIRAVAYEFQKGGNEMLRIART